MGTVDRTHPLLGTWKLKSYVVTADSGETSLPYGVDPNGYLSYAEDGRMQVIGTTNGRAASVDSAATDERRLYQTMFAYAGSYSIDGGTVTHHVDISWNEVWNGTDQVRSYAIDANVLTISSRFADPTTGIEAQYVLVWERVAPPH